MRQKLERPPAVQETAEKLGIGDKMPLTELEQRLVPSPLDGEDGDEDTVVN